VSRVGALANILLTSVSINNTISIDI